MERVEYPVLPLEKPKPIKGPTSIGSTESITGRVQVVREPRGQWEWAFDYSILFEREIAEFEAFLNDMEDGANWTSVSGFGSITPTHEDFGIDPVMAWAEGGGWLNGNNWEPSLPDAKVAAAASIGDREVSIDLTNWGGNFWRGFRIGFFPFAPGLFEVQRVLSVAGNVGTCRIWPALDRDLTTDHYVTLHPAMFMALVPGASNPGDRRARQLTGASIIARQVLYADVAGTD